MLGAPGTTAPTNVSNGKRKAAHSEPPGARACKIQCEHSETCDGGMGRTASHHPEESQGSRAPEAVPCAPSPACVGDDILDSLICFLEENEDGSINDSGGGGDVVQSLAAPEEEPAHPQLEPPSTVPPRFVCHRRERVMVCPPWGGGPHPSLVSFFQTIQQTAWQVERWSGGTPGEEYQQRDEQVTTGDDVVAKYVTGWS